MTTSKEIQLGKGGSTLVPPFGGNTGLPNGKPRPETRIPVGKGYIHLEEADFLFVARIKTKRTSEAAVCAVHYRAEQKNKQIRGRCR